MAHDSHEAFRVLHALRIKGFAKVEMVAELGGVHHDVTVGHLTELQSRELAMYREARALWQLTAPGKEHHANELAAEQAAAAEHLAALKDPYHRFLELNEAFKALCGDWQLRDGQPNDHTDVAYDKQVIDKLSDLDADARPIVSVFGSAFTRYALYVPRLEAQANAVRNGQQSQFTGVMCGSYHDVWMELHEDLILTQGIDRVAEGSF